MNATPLACTILALTLHGACFAAFRGAQPARLPTLRPRTTEVQIAVLAPKPPTPPPIATPEPKAPDPARTHARTRAPARAPEPARAAPLLTQTDTTKPLAQDEPVRFVTDPNGRDFGYGIVARGGSAEQSPELQPAPAPRVSRAAPTATQLSRSPQLLAHDGCRGFFPKDALEDHGDVAVIATVRSNGVLARLEIQAESPRDQGFARAARSCLEKQAFSPALDPHGNAVAARTRINVRFSR